MPVKVYESPRRTHANRPAMDEALWTAREVADYLRWDLKTVLRKALSGELPARRVGGSWRFVPDEIRDLGRQ